jgi:hypothetical protein
MPTTIAPGVNVQAGVVTSVLPPNYADVGNSVIACVIFNLSSSVLTVTGTFGQRFLQPLTADLFPCPGIQGAPSIAPATIATANTYLGIAQAVFYFQGDTVPVNYPAQLVPFPGGSTQVVNGLLPLLSGSVTIQPPPGTGTLTIQGTNSGRTGAGSTLITVTGTQSGTAYLSSTELGGGVVATIDLVGTNDSSFNINFNTSGGGNKSLGTINVYASPSTPVPTFATLSTGQTTSVTPIAAPTSGAWYIFGVDFLGANQNSNVVLTANGLAFAVLLSGLGSAGAFIDHDECNGFRATTAVTASYATAINVVIRYAPGP